MFPRKKGHKKDVAPISPLTPPSMETDDLDPAYVIFHQPLPIAARRSDHIWGAVPSPIRLAVDWLNKKGLHEEGLYRVPGKATTFATYKALFDRGVEFDFFELHEMAPENVAMVLIKYLQALPEPIYSSKYEAHFKLALAIQNDQERATVLKGIMYMIPLAYRETIKVLVDHLRLVASNSEVNKMTIRNVELTWSLSVGQMTGALMKVLGESPFPVPSTLQYYVPLELALENTPRSMTAEVFKVPYAVTTLIKFLKENDGPAHPNLFSTEPKSHDLIEDIVYVLNGGSVNTENTLPAEMTTVDAAVALKLWISSIPGEAGLFPETMRPDFVRICPPPAEGKSVNFGTMPDKLEALVWKLPDAHLETIKTITNFLRQWTTYAPEDMTSIRAIELVFPSYPVPLQHVLAYLLHHHDSLFLADDSDLTAHLQSLVFGGLNGAAIGGVGVGIGLTSPGGAMPLAALSSPLIASPRQYAANTAKPQSNPTSPAANRTIPDPGIATSPPGGENAVSADATVAASSSSVTSPVTTDDAQSASESPVFSTPEREGKKKKDKSTDSPSTPGTKAKKSKTLKIGSTTSSPAKIKKIKEAEDTASPSKSDKAKTPKSEKVKDKTPKSSPKVIAAATVSASSTDPAVASIGSTSSESTPKPKKAKLAKSPSFSTETPTPSSEASPPSKDKKKPAIIEEVPVTAQPTSTASKTNLSRSASSDLGEAHDSGSSKEESSSTSTATTSTAMTASTATVTATVSVPSPTSLPASSTATASTSTTATTQSESTPTGSPSSGRVSSGRPGSGRAQRRGEKELAALLTSIVAANEEEMAAKQKAKEEKRASADKRKGLTEKEAPTNEDGNSQDGSGEEDNDEEDGLAAMVVPGSPPTRVQRKSGKRKSDPANAASSAASPGDGDSTSSSSSKKKRRSKESVEDDPPSESGSQREGESERSTESNGKKRRVKSTEIASADIVTGLDDGTDKPKKRKSGDVSSNGTPERSEKRRSKKLEDGILTETGSSGDSTASPGDSSSGSPGKATRKEKVAATTVTDPAATASPKKNRIKVSTATES